MRLPTGVPSSVIVVRVFLALFLRCLPVFGRIITLKNKNIVNMASIMLF